MSVKLEVGKKYRDREGNIVEIVKKVENRIQPFLGDDYCYYTSEGWWSTKESKFDLIEEVPEGVTLRVGGKYLNREGDIVEITRNESSPKYPFGDNYCRTYTKTGVYCVGETCVYDLIKEVSGGLTLKVGHKYLTRKGEIVEIVRKIGGTSQPFVGRDNCYYTPEGRFYTFIESEHDLIEEVPEGLTLKVGHKYLTREGDVVEILFNDGDEELPLRGDNSYWYTLEGSVNICNDHPRDIISEYTESTTEDTPKGKHFDDLTQIDVPFGELDESTQLRLKVAHYEGEYLQYKWERETTWFKKGNKNSWINTTCYRVRPKTTTHKATVQVDLEGNILKDTVQLVED